MQLTTNICTQSLLCTINRLEWVNLPIRLPKDRMGKPKFYRISIQWAIKDNQQHCIVFFRKLFLSRRGIRPLKYHSYHELWESWLLLTFDYSLLRTILMRLQWNDEVNIRGISFMFFFWWLPFRKLKKRELPVEIRSKFRVLFFLLQANLGSLYKF